MIKSTKQFKATENREYAVRAKELYKTNKLPNALTTSFRSTYYFKTPYVYSHQQPCLVDTGYNCVYLTINM